MVCGRLLFRVGEVWELHFGERVLTVCSKELARMHATLLGIEGRDMNQLETELVECPIPERIDPNARLSSH